MEEILRVENLSYTYGEGTPFCHHALRNITLHIKRGEFLGIIGRTGSGKSTLIQHLNGLLRPTDGRILLNGTDIWEDAKKIRNVRFTVGLVFQYPEYQLFEETVYKDIAFGPKNMGLDDAEIDRRVHAAAQFAGVREELLQKSPFQLSGGQKRRVAIAGVIAMEPEVLILDEPTAGLDPRGCESLLANIRDYHARKNCTIILVSHSMDEIARNAKRIVVLRDGQILCDDTPQKIFANENLPAEAGLDLPRAANIAAQLRANGVPVREDIYTIEDLAQELLCRKKE